MNEKWFKLRSKYTKALVAKRRKASEKIHEQMEQLKRDQIIVVAQDLGFEAEFDGCKRADYNKFYLIKRARYRARAFFDGGRLKSIIKTKRSDTMRWSYLINGQAVRGCECIYWRPIQLD